MSFKEDPLQQRRQSPRTLWLDREGMETARENFYKAWREHDGPTAALRDIDDKRTWDISFAAAVAAFSFIMEGRLEP